VDDFVATISCTVVRIYSRYNSNREGQRIRACVERAMKEDA
jgi:hypothetical protein